MYVHIVWIAIVSLQVTSKGYFLTQANNYNISMRQHDCNVLLSKDAWRSERQDRGNGRLPRRYDLQHRCISNTKNFHKQFYNGADKAPQPGKRCCYDSGSQTSNIQALILNVGAPIEPVNLGPGNN